MKNDEYNMLISGKAHDKTIPPKRLAHIQNKWHKHGWLSDGNRLTKEFFRIKALATDIHDSIKDLDDCVVTVCFRAAKNYEHPTTCGILRDCGDNGYHLYTRKSICGNWSWYLGDYHLEDEIAYIDKHPNPKNIWRRMNFLAWKHLEYPDYFHQKIQEFSPTTVRNYDVKTSIWSFSNPHGRVGECFPWCQCKNM